MKTTAIAPSHYPLRCKYTRRPTTPPMPARTGTSASIADRHNTRPNRYPRATFPTTLFARSSTICTWMQLVIRRRAYFTSSTLGRQILRMSIISAGRVWQERYIISLWRMIVRRPESSPTRTTTLAGVMMMESFLLSGHKEVSHAFLRVFACVVR